MRVRNFEIGFPFRNWVKISKFAICAGQFRICVNLQTARNIHVCTHAEAIPGLLTPYPARPADLLTGSPAGDGLTEDGSSNGKLRVIMCSLTCLLSHSITKKNRQNERRVRRHAGTMQAHKRKLSARNWHGSFIWCNTVGGQQKFCIITPPVTHHRLSSVTSSRTISNAFSPQIPPSKGSCLKDGTTCYLYMVLCKCAGKFRLRWRKTCNAKLASHFVRSSAPSPGSPAALISLLLTSPSLSLSPLPFA